uniref:Ku domain-containing protein n=1 Tax=Clastoptera arizonana TaxID=38151 RepID=A0A1B6EAK7_9HEMI
MRNLQKKPQGWHVSLTIGPDIQIPVTGYKMVDSSFNIGWNVQTVDNEPIIKDHGFFKKDETCVENQDIIDGYVFGNSIIPFSAVEKETMTYDSGEKCLNVLQTAPIAECLPKHLFIGDTVHYFVPQPDDEEAAVAFAAVVKALYDLDLAFIVRKVYRNGTIPMLGAMIPKIEDDHYILLFLEIPFKQDNKKVNIPSLRYVKSTEEQISCIDRLITSMDLTNPEIFEEDEEPYAPEKLIDPFKQHVDKCIVMKALHKDSPLPSQPEKFILDLIKPLPVIEERSKDVLEDVKKVFPLEKVDTDKNKKEAAVMFDLGNNPDEAPNINGEIKMELDASMDDLVKSSIDHISTVNPESDFESILKNGVPFVRVCDELQSVIIKLFISCVDDDVKKPLKVLAFLRKHCLDYDPMLYNIWLGFLKDIIIERENHNIWELIIQESLSLITSKESEKSNLTMEEAKLFNEVKKQTPESNKMDEIMDADDLVRYYKNI